MKSRALNYIAATLSLILLLPFAALAGPVQINKVQQVIKGSSARGWQDGSSELRPNTTTKADDPVKTTETSDPTKKTATETTGQQQKQDPTQTQTQQVRTETVEEFMPADDVCDCPQTIVNPAAGGFPWWVLGGGAVPLAFVRKKDRETEPPTESTPTPTPPTTPEPEPLTLLLFGSGLLALGVGARKRFASSISDDKTVGEG